MRYREELQLMISTSSPLYYNRNALSGGNGPKKQNACAAYIKYLVLSALNGRVVLFWLIVSGILYLPRGTFIMEARDPDTWRK